MQHWRTTLLGALTILATLAKAGIEYLNGRHVDLSTLSAGLTAGVGLIAAADGKQVTAIGDGGEVGDQQVAPTTSPQERARGMAKPQGGAAK